MSDEVGPVYGVKLIDTLPLGKGAMLQAMPSRNDLSRIAEHHGRVAAGYEVLLAHYHEVKASNDVLVKALQKIAKWIGEFPDTGRTWEDGTPMSYGAAFGSNGERDYMRDVAITALNDAEIERAVKS